MRLRYLFAIALAVAANAAAQTDVQVNACMQPTAVQVPAWTNQGIASSVIRKRVETAFASCSNPQASGPYAAFVAAVNSDLAQAAISFGEGTMPDLEYAALIADRERKYHRAQIDPFFRAMLGTGDSDGDLIPDALDQCPNTPALTPTNDSGCPTVNPCVFGRCTSHAGFGVSAYRMHWARSISFGASVRSSQLARSSAIRR